MDDKVKIEKGAYPDGSVEFLMDGISVGRATTEGELDKLWASLILPQKPDGSVSVAIVFGEEDPRE